MMTRRLNLNKGHSTSDERGSAFQIVSVIVAGVCVASLLFFVFSLVRGTHISASFFDTHPKLTVFFKSETSDAETEKVAAEMRAKPYVQRVDVISKQQALQSYRESNKNEPLLLELVTADILPSSMEVWGNGFNSKESIEKDLKDKVEIDEVIVQPTFIESIQKSLLSIIKR
jgi:cell division transport system permease protein